jgi:hypothetical protein
VGCYFVVGHFLDVVIERSGRVQEGLEVWALPEAPEMALGGVPFDADDLPPPRRRPSSRRRGDRRAPSGRRPAPRIRRVRRPRGARLLRAQSIRARAAACSRRRAGARGAATGDRASLNRLPARREAPLRFPTPRGGYLDLRNFRRRAWIPAQLAAGIEPLRRPVRLDRSESNIRATPRRPASAL